MTKREHMKTKTDQELVKLLTETRVALRETRFSAAGSRAKDSTTSKKLRAVVARILTEQTARSTSSRQPMVATTI